VGRAERAIYEALAEGGWAPFSGATCLGGHAWVANPVDPMTLAPIHLAGPTDHARNIVWHTRRISRAGGIRFWSEAYALKLEEHAGGITAHIERNGVFARVRANFIVLACGVLETVALLQRSGIVHESLGQDFTFTTEATAYVATEIPREVDAMESAITRFASISTKRLYVPEIAGLAKGGKISAYDARGFEGDSRHAAKIRATTGNDPDIYSPPSRLTVKLSFKGESTPWEGKRLTPPGRIALGGNETVIDYTPHPHDRRLVAHVADAFEEIAALFPGGRIIASYDNVDGPDRSSAHLHGGASCGTAMERTIIGPDCAVREMPHVFVVDASVMPSSGATNSSLTVMANAARVMDALIARL
jgi:hypothetical protein